MDNPSLALHMFFRGGGGRITKENLLESFKHKKILGESSVHVLLTCNVGNFFKKLDRPSSFVTFSIVLVAKSQGCNW